MNFEETGSIESFLERILAVTCIVIIKMIVIVRHANLCSLSAYSARFALTRLAACIF